MIHYPQGWFKAHRGPKHLKVFGVPSPILYGLQGAVWTLRRHMNLSHTNKHQYILYMVHYWAGSTTKNVEDNFFRLGLAFSKFHRQ